MHQALRLILTLSAAWLLTACAAPARPLSAYEQARLAALLPADALLVGEQHDAPEHQQLQRQIVDWLAARGDLAALAMEMAERPRTTAGLPRDASESAVRAALAWDEAGWPWATYGPVVMAAVRAGVPVRGANLPRADMRRAMADTTLDARLPPAMLAEQESRIREGHCHALPESQIRPMTRIQIARDIAMAQTLTEAANHGKTVLLVAGNGHVQRGLGVPQHLPAGFESKVLSVQARQAQAAMNTEASDTPRRAGADLVWSTPALPPRDHCAAFRPAAAPR